MTITTIDMPTYPVAVVYDTAADTPIQGADADHSVVIPNPRFVQFNTIPSGTTVQVQRKVHKDAGWENVGTAIGNTDGNKIVEFSLLPPNFVQLVRTGAGDVKAFAQFAV